MYDELVNCVADHAPTDISAEEFMAQHMVEQFFVDIPPIRDQVLAASAEPQPSGRARSKAVRAPPAVC